MPEKNLKPCKPGHIRNPDTNRCIKIGGVVYKKSIKPSARKSERKNKIPMSKKVSRKILNRTSKRISKRIIIKKRGNKINPYDTRTAPVFVAPSKIGTWALDKKIGQGGQGSIYSVYQIDMSKNDKWLIKIAENVNYNSPRYNKVPYKWRVNLSQYSIINEIKILNIIKQKCDNIYVPLIFEDTHYIVDNYAYFIIENFKKGTLDSYIKNKRINKNNRITAELGIIPTKTVFGIVARLIKCKNLISKCKIYHCDIKPENIAIADDPVRGVVLIDYGISTWYSTTQNLKQFSGTLSMVTTNFLEEKQLSHKDDYECIGMTAVSLLLGNHLPWMDELDNKPDYLTKIKYIKNILMDKNLPKILADLCKVPFIEEFLSTIRNRNYKEFDENFCNHLLVMALSHGISLDDKLKF